ncbi:hypothetical protein JMUB7519_28120 [Staphylococcus aureus]
MVFFKQKTAYEMQRSLVGSEMCIRDRVWATLVSNRTLTVHHGRNCLLYTSDAADDGESVDLGGRRIIKKTTERV